MRLGCFAPASVDLAQALRVQEDATSVAGLTDQNVVFGLVRQHGKEHRTLVGTRPGEFLDALFDDHVLGDGPDIDPRAARTAQRTRESQAIGNQEWHGIGVSLVPGEHFVAFVDELLDQRRFEQSQTVEAVDHALQGLGRHWRMGRGKA